eukprot:Platyproteum_vivax@DN6246_c0_g1_i2.p1
MDWMSPHDVNEELAVLLKKMDPVNGKIFWRSFSDDVHMPSLNFLKPKRVQDFGDRVPMYFSTWIAHIANSEHTVVPRIDKLSDYNKSFLAQLQTGAKVVVFPFIKNFLLKNQTITSNKHQNHMEAFYKFQASGYDNFRETLLHARPALMNYVPILKAGNMVWVDVGGGTARNLEFFSPSTIRNFFKKIYIVDISASLLAVAKARSKAMGIDEIVSCVECDFTGPQALKDLCGAGEADLVTMSYSLSMIPDQNTAVKNCVKLLKPNGKGVLGVADFVLEGKNDARKKGVVLRARKMEAAFHKWWFSNDHVHLLTHDNMHSLTAETETLWNEKFRGSVPLLPGMRPYHIAFLAQSR